MGLLDPLRRLFAPGADEADGTAAPARGDGGGEGPPDGIEFGPAARSYVETGGPPEGAPDPERDGRLNVLVTMDRDTGPEGFVDTDDLERYIESLDGDVEHAHGGGTVSGWIPKEALSELAASPDVTRVEVTIPDDGPVREDPEFEE